MNNIQTIIFSSKFFTTEDAIKWLERNGIIPIGDPDHKFGHIIFVIKKREINDNLILSDIGKGVVLILQEIGSL